MHHRMVVSRVDSEGKPFWCGTNEIVRLYYVCKHPHQRNAAKLEGVTTFMEGVYAKQPRPIVPLRRSVRLKRVKSGLG